MKNLISILLVYFILVLVSCSKSEIETNDDNFFDNLFPETSIEDGNFLNITKTSVMGESASIAVHFFPTDFKKNQFLKETNFLDLNLNEENSLFITPSQKNDFNSFSQRFGDKNVVLSSRLKSTEGDFEIYFPEIITVTNINELTNLSSPPHEIKWNKDDKNPNGKVVIAIIHRGVKENELIRYEDYATVKIVDDTGTSMISYDDLSKFPDNSELDILIGRGNQDEINEITITATTTDLVSTKNY